MYILQIYENKEELISTFYENSRYFAKHFVSLHRRMCLALVKIAKFQLRVYMETQAAVHTVDCLSVHIDGCLAIPNEV